MSELQGEGLTDKEIPNAKRVSQIKKEDGRGRVRGEKPWVKYAKDPRSTKGKGIYNT